MRASNVGIPASIVAFCLAMGCVAAGCASTTWSSALADGADKPHYARAELALIAGGDAASAATLAEAALRDNRSEGRAEREARAFFALVVASDALGDIERPLPFLAQVLDGATDPTVAARVAAEAGRAWARLDGKNAASPDIRAALEKLARSVTPVGGDEVGWEAARSQALRELVTAERLRAGPAAAKVAAEQAGFVLDWTLSAPWGDAPALDFTTPLGPETRPLAERETTGAGWDIIPVATTRQQFSDGEVTFFDLPTTGGVAFAQADVPAGARTMMVRLECNRMVALFIDGLQVVVRQQLSEPWLQSARVRLPGGAHRVTVKLASQDGRGFFRLQLTDVADSGAPAQTVQVSPINNAAATRVPAGDARAAVLALLDLEARLSRPIWDPDGARARSRVLEQSFGPHTSLDLLAARLALGDTVAPPAERRQTARARYEAVLARSPGHPAARRGLARIERDDEHPDRALVLLRPADGAKNDARTQLDLLDLYRERGWEAEALTTADSLSEQATASPRLMQELIDLYKAFGRVGAAEALANTLEKAFTGAGLDRLYGLWSDSGKIVPSAELSLFEWEPQRHAALRTAVAGMRRDHPDAVRIDGYLTDFLARRPQDAWALGERVRLGLQTGAPSVTELILKALDTHPDFAPMEQLLHQLDNTPEPFDMIEDAHAIVGRWLAFKASPAGAAWAAYPVVNALERTRIEVRKDGSTLELSHRVRIVQTKQGVDDVGDVRPPDGARLLIARTLKADGRVLEPERTEGKAELSFPELEPGDAVETAWVLRNRVTPSEGGYLTGVSFASWGAPMFELDTSITAVAGLDLSVKRFGGAPEGVTTHGADGSRTIAWRLGRLAPVAKEPLSVSPRSFFPFVDVRVLRAEVAPTVDDTRDSLAWARIARAYASRLTYLGRQGPRLEALAKRLLRQKDPASAAFDWVKTEVTDQEQLNTFETPAEEAIANRKGNRALVLWALLQTMGRDSELYLCAPERDGPAEDRAAPTPNPNRFFYPVVSAPNGVYFDPSRPYTPPGDLPAELGGAMCLSPLANDFAQAHFIELPKPAKPATFDATLTLALDGDGNARGTLTGRALGAAASPLRQAYLAQDEERQRMLFEQWLASLVVGARLVGYHVDDAASATSPMRWRLDIELPSYASRDGDALVVQRPLKSLVHSDFSGVPELAQLVSTPSRVTPLRVLPFSEHVVIALTAPAGMQLVAAPPDIALRGIAQSSVMSGRTLTVTRHIELAPGRVNPSEYDLFRRDIGAAIRALETSLRYVPNR